MGGATYNAKVAVEGMLTKARDWLGSAATEAD